MNEGGRGIILIAVAVLIGAVLLGKGLDDSTSTASREDGSAATDDGGEDSTADTTSGSTLGNPIAPAEINVIVANGSGVPDAAAAVSQLLTDSGYTPLPPTNTTVDTTATPLDSVFFATNPNTQAQAEQVASDLGLAPSSVQPYPGEESGPAPIGLAQVLVVLGSAQGQLAYSTAGATTATTVP
jgi:hypothetical protein